MTVCKVQSVYNCRRHLREGVRMPLEIAIMFDPLPEVASTIQTIEKWEACILRCDRSI